MTDRLTCSHILTGFLQTVKNRIVKYKNETNKCKFVYYFFSIHSVIARPSALVVVLLSTCPEHLCK